MSWNIGVKYTMEHGTLNVAVVPVVGVVPVVVSRLGSLILLTNPAPFPLLNRVFD